MITVGLTGPMGAGKTTVLEVFREMGAKTVDADLLAKDLMVNDTQLRKRLIEAFGVETYLPDGTLNKPHLIHQAFHQGQVDTLNAIVHPAVKESTLKQIRVSEREGVPLFVIEGALLLNHGRPEHFDKVMLVLSRRQDQIERVKERDRQSEEEISARLEAQPDFEKLRPLADVVIENTGTVGELCKKVREVAELWLSEGSADVK